MHRIFHKHERQQFLDDGFQCVWALSFDPHLIPTGTLIWTRLQTPVHQMSVLALLLNF